MAREFGSLIGGLWKTSGEVLEVKSPYDGQVVGRVHLAGPALIEEALASATEAFKVLKKMPSWKRAEALLKTADGIDKRAAELARTITLESGKPIRDSRGEVKRAALTSASLPKRLAVSEERSSPST